MEVLRSAVIEKHSCWICQEEISSEVRLLQHYENHMRPVGAKYYRFSDYEKAPSYFAVDHQHL